MSRLFSSLCLALTLTSTLGAEIWVMTYARQLGKHMTVHAGSRADLWLHDIDGTVPAKTGFTDAAHNATAFYGTPDATGHALVTFSGDAPYSFRIYDPSVDYRYIGDTDACIWQCCSQSGHYAWEFHYLRLPGGYVGTPNRPSYHYDANDGTFNDPPKDAPGFDSDAHHATVSAAYFAQTFVVLDHQMAVVGVKALLTRPGTTEPIKVVASIHEGSPSGKQLGTNTTAMVTPDDFAHVFTWPMGDVPITQGATLALVVRAADGLPLTAYLTDNDNYKQGHAFVADTAMPNNDLVAVVIPAGHMC